MKKVFYIIVSLLLLAACSKSEIETWDSTPCVWFDSASKDTVIFSFYSLPETVTEYIQEFPITIAGEVSDIDRQVGVKILGTHNPESRYEIVSATIPAGKVDGTVQVKVYKTDNLKTAHDTLGIEIIASADFEVGLENYTRRAMVVSNFIARPVWWDMMMEMFVLGSYSDRKLKVIYEVLGSDEYFHEGAFTVMYKEDAAEIIYRLNKYCKDNNIKENPSDSNVISFVSLM